MLRITLQALMALEYDAERYNVVVVHDGAGPNTAAVVDELADDVRTIEYVEQPRSGVARARNLGAEAADGDLLIFLDDDIVVEPDHVGRHLAARQRYGECLVNGHWEFSPFAREMLDRTPFGRYRVSLEDWVKTAITMEPIGDGRFRPSGVTACNLSISSRQFAELGGFDESFPFAGCEDQEFSFRAGVAGIPFVYDPAIRLQHNDDRFTLDQFCSRQRSGALTFVYLAARHPEQFASRQLLTENGPIAPFDPMRLRVKKVGKRLYGSRLGLAVARFTARVLERIAPDGKALRRVYAMTIGAHIFLGVRDGLQRLPEAQTMPTTAMHGSSIDA